MYRMFFNTGVKPESRLNKDGQLVLARHEHIVGGTIQIEYFLERKPEEGLTLRYLAPLNYLSYMQKNEVAIKIVDGGVLSYYAIFLKR